MTVLGSAVTSEQARLHAAHLARQRRIARAAVSRRIPITETREAVTAVPVRAVTPEAPVLIAGVTIEAIKRVVCAEFGVTHMPQDHAAAARGAAGAVSRPRPGRRRGARRSARRRPQLRAQAGERTQLPAAVRGDREPATGDGAASRTRPTRYSSQHRMPKPCISAG